MDGYTFAHIDASRQLTLSALEVGDSEIQALAEQMGEPNLAFVFEAAQNHDVALPLGPALLDFLAHPQWRRVFEADLQCMCETQAGEPFLTTFFDLDTLAAALSHCDGPLATLAPVVAAWREAGFTDGMLEGYMNAAGRQIDSEAKR